MSGRIAHRSNYRHMHQFVQPSKTTRQPFSLPRWSYRRQRSFYEKRPLGYGLSLIHASYCAARRTMFPQF